MNDKSKPISEMSFEEAMAALEQVVSRLESGNAALEDSIDLYTYGTELKAYCETKLRDAQAKIEKITVGADGQASGATPLDVE
ncbi:exodeoxyribonuclease 7 small subunit [Kordiimonas sediminis]|uniref:Exodeoxyribonuclease 7 small subunit n=1 Tax=Kordiimonas sediminis TaxID=1735581 RepID=A0A919E9P6_9PROT|nr:exodeoxyribonuclease VII small subunit [Kordiimonas sediminis]GHF26630.1 exodeoxyribonuclease 7 small subunit [Kordiimonas sediminis]